MALSWAGRRRLIIGLIVGAVFVAVIAAASTWYFYAPPSCSDGKKNQDETGIDCGGSCPYLCIADERAPVTLYALAMKNGNGRIDVIASIENKNADAAAKDVSYTVKLYGADRTLIQAVKGSIDLPPRTTVPLFIPDVAIGNQPIANVFVEFNEASLKWYSVSKDPRIVPVVVDKTLGGSTGSPRVEASFSNTSTTVVKNVRAVAIIHGHDGNVMAASATIIPSIRAQEEATGIFIWNQAFPSTPALIEVIPVIPLP